ncbi:MULTISPECIES: SIMPL domain-containing protein [Rhodopirellula]|uniref:SIMPL domain-containing protein n=1 Tax=Rhodopirellula TaxID=265488 RepID=UPI001564C0A4|nr:MULTISPECIES: SIMPL domain-containing protein [Rhodopirellula]
MRLLAFLLCCVGCTLLPADEQRFITVTATGEVNVIPDEVVLELNVRTREKKLLDAKRKSDSVSRSLLQRLSDHKVPKADIKLDDLEVTPYYGEYGERQETPIAYNYSRSILVRLTDFDKIEVLLADAFDKGLTNVSRMQFRVSSQRKHQFEARRLAVTHAKEKAEHLTELTGMKLGPALQIEEHIEYNEAAADFFAVADAAQTGNKTVNSLHGNKYTFVVQRDDASAESLKLNTPGQVSISADVTIKFEMLPAKNAEP